MTEKYRYYAKAGHHHTTLFIHPYVCFGQSLINMKHYSVQDGLSQKNVHNFIQDDNGYIWMSTWNGLERFDGYSFYNYKTYPESPIRISNHRFTKIKKSSLNNIWCLTYDKRCYLFNTRTYEYQDPFLFNKSLTNSVSKLYALGKGITWAVGMQNELYRIDEISFRRQSPSSYIPEEMKEIPFMALPKIRMEMNGF